MAICESFLHEIWGHGVLWHGTSEQFVKVFSTKISFFFHQFAKVISLESFPLYGITHYHGSYRSDIYSGVVMVKGYIIVIPLPGGKGGGGVLEH